METKYSNTFKIEAVKKALSRAKGSSMNSIARSLGIANSTLYGWVKAVENKDLNESPTSRGFCEKKPCQWTSQEKLEAVVHTNNLTQGQITEYCKKKGIFPHHLQVILPPFFSE